jgi:1,4-alpha-glucan branching enzyme
MSIPKAKKDAPPASLGKTGGKGALEDKKIPALPKSVTFEFFAPLSHVVCLAGSFNDWSTSATPLARDKSGKWSVTLSLLPGSYEYRFVVDGEWKNDQQPVPSVQNPFGSWNCVIVVASS